MANLLVFACFLGLVALSGAQQYCTWSSPERYVDINTAYPNLTVPCDDGFCGTKTLSPIGTSSYPTTECVGAVYCRIDPTTQKLCLKSSILSTLPEQCYGQNQLIIYTYYAYTDGTSLDLIMGSGTCENQLSEQQRSAYYPLCDTAINVNADGYSPGSTAETYMTRTKCTSGTCEDEVSGGVYILPHGVTSPVTVYNGTAIAIRYTVDNICFSWKQTKLTYTNTYPVLTSECKTDCVRYVPDLTYSLPYNLTVWTDGSQRTLSYSFSVSSSPAPTNSPPVLPTDPPTNTPSATTNTAATTGKSSTSAATTAKTTTSSSSSTTGSTVKPTSKPTNPPSDSQETHPYTNGPGSSTGFATTVAVASSDHGSKWPTCPSTKPDGVSADGPATLKYCAGVWSPYCDSGCTQYSGTSVPSGQDVDMENVVYSYTYGTAPCLHINGEGETDIWCRVDPGTNELCIIGENTYESCYRAREFIQYSYYIRATAYTYTRHDLMLASGTCANTTQETTIERAQCFPLCKADALKEPNSGSVKTVTVTKFHCTLYDYKTSCSNDPSGTYTLKQGVQFNTEVIDDVAIGMLLTGDSVCFSWEKKETHYYDTYGTDYDSTCYDKCQSLSSTGTFMAEITYTTSLYSNPNGVTYAYQITVPSSASSSSRPSSSSSSSGGTSGSGDHDGVQSSSASTVLLCLVLALVPCIILL